MPPPCAEAQRSHEPADNEDMRKIRMNICNGARILALLVLAMLRPAPARALDLARYLPPPDASYAAEEVRLHASGRYSLAGTLTLPTRGVLRNGHLLRYPAIVLLSGPGKEDRDGSAADGTAAAYRPLRDLADTLTRRGIAVLRLDDPGVGASTGSFDSMTTLDRANDARAAIAYLRRRSELDPRRIGMLGMSEGASIAALVAATDEDLHGSVLMACAEPLGFAVASPVLVMQGDADDTVPPAGADRLVLALRRDNLDVTLRHFAGLGHAFVSPQAFSAPPGALRLAPEIRGAVADWVVAHFGGAVEGPAPRPARVRHRRH